MLNLPKSIYSKNFLLTQRGKVVSLTNRRSSQPYYYKSLHDLHLMPDLFLPDSELSVLVMEDRRREQG